MQRSNWSSFLGKPTNRNFLFWFFPLTVTIFLFVYFALKYVEGREGIIIEQRFSTYLGEAHDFSLIIFFCTYTSVVLALFYHFRNAPTMIKMLWAFVLMHGLRVIALLIVPLNPPTGIIPLNDPFLHYTFYNARDNLKDLFFSGHVATICVMAFSIHHAVLRKLLILFAVITGVLLIQQRVHYVVDVIAAPLFAWCAIKFSAITSRSLSA